MKNIITDNENAVKNAFDREDHLQAFIMIHSLTESLLRVFLNISKDSITFSELIVKYKKYLKDNYQTKEIFVDELTQFNRRRNRVIHELWSKGYTKTNNQAKEAAIAALSVYSLLIEFLQTFDSELSTKGFQFDES